MSWYVFWILELSPKEASGDSEDKIQEESTNDNSWRLDEDDTGSCCGNGNGSTYSYSSDDDDDKTTGTEVCWVMQHKGEVINSKSSEPEGEGEETELDAGIMEARQRRLREESKEFWDACIAHGY